TAAASVSLSSMNLLNNTHGAILGANVNGFSLVGCQATGNGQVANQDPGIKLTDTTGAVTFTSDTVAGSGDFNVSLATTPGSTAAITALTVTGGSYNNSVQNGGFLVSLKNSSSLATALFTGVTFSNNFSKGLQLQQNDNAVLGNGVGAPATGSITVS